MLFLQGQLETPALPLSRRKGPGWGPASLLDQPLGPCPGSPGSVKNPVWGLETEDQVLQVNWWLPCPLKLSEPCGHRVGRRLASAVVPRLPSLLISSFPWGRLARSLGEACT